MSSVEFEASFLANYSNFATAAVRSGSKEMDLFRTENRPYLVSEYHTYSVFHFNYSPSIARAANYAGTQDVPVKQLRKIYFAVICAYEDTKSAAGKEILWCGLQCATSIYPMTLQCNYTYNQDLVKKPG